MVLTSVHAVPASLPSRGRPAYCVGPATAKAARDAGFRVIEGSGDLAGLKPLIAVSGLDLIHPHGRHVAGDSGVPGIVVYDQLEVPLNEAAQALLAGRTPVILPLFSPRAARLVAAEIGDAPAPLSVVALSEAVAQSWRSVAGDRGSMTIAAAPTAAATLDAIRPLLSGNIPDRDGLNRT
ncbi:uroporphyrinogen-III synthase [Paracoccus sp. TK19116]|uniref:Uroporphyrinogen-III synthase n=1 Tax=Paracoccus albicereus TaxID=2922394 RepID=A0ABT1MSQ2_9RHOB|nr:uroporphyrinogen-III synthase [Paracoccus albicereus]